MNLAIFVSFLLCTLTLASPAVRQNETVVEKEAYKFLGQIENFSKQCESTCVSSYYLSLNPGAWEASRRDCQNNFGDGASLAAIETEDEFSKVYDFLDSGTAASTFWVNGREGLDKRVQWEFNGAKTDFDDTFLKWDTGEPNLDGNRLNRLQLIIKSEIVFAMVKNSEQANAICEIQKCE